MAFSRRGFTVTALVLLVLLAVVGGVLFLGGKAGVGPLADEGDTNANHGGTQATPPAKCPMASIFWLCRS